ncbi:glycoside hydrolase family 3 N-terminal domain-containing protein, partial [Promineifilum sp.]|uniref:glycoside hydrolase family 3 N-terminal domain-containing protein n=1 Tax=Promineifilum sp. TaxID=2664178 RepID=UPI0035AF894E
MTHEAFVEALLGRMTTAEKIGQMTQVEKNSLRPGDVAALGLGSVLSGGGGNPEPNTPAAWAEMVRAFQEEALGSRLGIPLLYGVDAVHGHNNVRGATIFPHLVSLGAAGDPELARRVARATAVECAATGIRWDFAPMVSVVQDVRWGRAYEAFGDGTAAVTELGAAYLRGLQDDGEGLAGPTA